MAVDPIQSDSFSTGAAQQVPVIPYEKRMGENWEWAMNESSLFFEGKGKVQETLKRIARRLEKHQIAYAVAGGMALFHHGHRRYTEDVDLLVTREDLQEIHEKLEGLGYVRLYAKSKQLRDADTGVKIDFLITGDFPGDGKPKEVSFPDPRDVSQEFNGIQFVNLPTFVTLKLTSGMTGANREKDIADVVELVKSRGLTEDLADKLAPSVQSKFREIVRNVQQARRYVADEQAVSQEQLKLMLADGVVRESGGVLVTTDPVVASKYNMIQDTEY